jgi:hypothetical protein
MRLGIGAFLMMCAFSINSWAGLSATVYGSYLSDDFSQTTSTQDIRQLYGASFMTALDSKDSFFVGWSYTSLLGTSTASSITKTFSSVDMGPVVSWWFGKGKVYNLTAAYNIISTATYEETSQTTKDWGGTGYYLAAGAELELFKGIHLGARMLYYVSNYTDQKVGAVASDVSVTRTWLMPLLTISYRK